MSDVEPLLTSLRRTADPQVVDEIGDVVAHGSDRDLNRINVLAFAETRCLDEDRTLAAFIHSARMGIFDLSWNVLCPGCGGVLESSTSLKAFRRDEYDCALCAAGYESTLDELIEVTFTVNPRVRRIAAHDPNTLPLGRILPSGVLEHKRRPAGEPRRGIGERALDTVELDPEKGSHLAQPPGRSRHRLRSRHTFDAVSRRWRRPDPERQALSMLIVRGSLRASDPDAARSAAPDPREPRGRAGPARNVDRGRRPAGLMGRRRPFLTAKRLLTHQSFRDIYRTDTLDIDQRLKITSLTSLFTDLKGSTELYERVGDLAAFDLVRAHFRSFTGSSAITAERSSRPSGTPSWPRSRHRIGPCGPLCGCGKPCGASMRRQPGPSAQDRHPRGTMPRGHVQRPPGLFRADRQRRVPGPGARQRPGDPRHPVPQWRPLWPEKSWPMAASSRSRRR